jgi:hypothetical protein
MARLNGSAWAAKPARWRMCGRLFVGDALLEEDVAPELREFVQKEHAMVRPRHLAWHGEVPPTDQPDVRDRVVRGAERAARDHRRAGAGAASHAVDARGLEGFRQAHRRQDGGEPPRQPRLARPRGAEQEEIWVRTPASASCSPRPLGVSEAMRALVTSHTCEAPPCSLIGSPHRLGRGASGEWSGPGLGRS